MTAIAVLSPMRQPYAQTGRDLGPQPPGQFDFWVLSLTWVPGFCKTHHDSQECGRDLGFALHGLWPESKNGYPSDCASDALPGDVRATNVTLFPSPQMIDHEWSKHGTCSGLGPSGFFDKTRSLLGSVNIPAEYQHGANIRSSSASTVKAAFLAANPGFSAGSLVVACTGKRISEIHICLDRNGGARVCENWERAEEHCH
jgi:ribonuclease T2